MGEPTGPADKQTDIAALTEELEELRAFKRMVERMPFGVNIVRIDRVDLAASRFLFLNEQAWKQGGVDPDEWVGRTFGEAMPGALELPEEHNFPMAYRRVVESGEPEVLEILYGQANMPESVFNLHCVPLGNDLCSLIYENITARRQAELKVKQQVEELARSNRDLEMFAYMASHDLQEPLRKVRTFGDRLVSRAADDLDERSQDYLQRMQGAAGRMQKLIDALLTYSRVATRSQPFTEVQLDTTLRNVLSDLEVQLERSGGEVVAGPLPEITADATQMRQLFQNLVGNALKFRDPDRAPRVEISAEAVADDQIPGGGWCIRVRDNGIGFDAEVAETAEAIFKPFGRLHARSRYPGTGIGLSICMKIAELHGGTIRASGVPGEGATFEVLLAARAPSGDPS